MGSPLPQVAIAERPYLVIVDDRPRLRYHEPPPRSARLDGARLDAGAGLIGNAGGLLDLREAAMEPLAQLIGSIFVVCAAPAGHRGTAGAHACQARESDQLPWRPHRFHRLRAVTDTSLSFKDAVAAASTGDIWLFRGHSLADRAIQTVTNSPVNHVGMAVAIDDLPPLLWHAELGRSLPDVWTGEHQRGVQLHLLAEAVTTWNERYGQRAWVRQLDGKIERHHEDRVMEIIDRFDGRPVPGMPGLVRQWATGRLRRSTSLETVYCAELVATTYQHMGLLPDRRPASWYDPGRFWSGDRIELVEPFALAHEIAVR